MISVINATASITKTNQIVQTLRIDINGIEYMGTIPSKMQYQPQPVYNHWSAVLNTILKKVVYPTDTRCEVYGLKFK